MRDPEGQAAGIFGDTADPSSYVVRAETEWALGELQDRVSEQHGSAWLTSPPGLGKSLLFAVLIVIVGVVNGLNVKGGAEGVGKVTTRSVVHGISAIVLTDMVFAFVAFATKR